MKYYVLQHLWLQKQWVCIFKLFINSRALLYLLNHNKPNNILMGSECIRTRNAFTWPTCSLMTDVGDEQWSGAWKSYEKGIFHEWYEVFPLEHLYITFPLLSQDSRLVLSLFLSNEGCLMLTNTMWDEFGVQVILLLHYQYSLLWLRSKDNVGSPNSTDWASAQEQEPKALLWCCCWPGWADWVLSTLWEFKLLRVNFSSWLGTCKSRLYLHFLV